MSLSGVTNNLPESRTGFILLTGTADNDKEQTIDASGVAIADLPAAQTNIRLLARKIASIEAALVDIGVITL